MIRFLAGFVGLGMLGLGLLGFLVGLHSIYDPVSAQMSNDNDPFGAPPTFSDSLLVTSVYLAVCLMGAFVCYLSARHRIKPKNNELHRDDDELK